MASASHIDTLCARNDRVNCIMLSSYKQIQETGVLWSSLKPSEKHEKNSVIINNGKLKENNFSTLSFGIFKFSFSGNDIRVFKGFRPKTERLRSNQCFEWRIPFYHVKIMFNHVFPSIQMGAVCFTFTAHCFISVSRRYLSFKRT